MSDWKMVKIMTPEFVLYQQKNNITLDFPDEGKMLRINKKDYDKKENFTIKKNLYELKAKKGMFDYKIITVKKINSDEEILSVII